MTTLDPKRVKSLLEYATPAPWVVGQDADETYTVQSIGAIRAVFCHGHYAGLTAPNDLEDIHLAALAPDLALDWLRMRELIHAHYEGMRKIILDSESTAVDKTTALFVTGLLDHILGGTQ